MPKEILCFLPPEEEGLLATDPYTLRDTLTIGDAAMIYCDRHPRPGFFYGNETARGFDPRDPKGRNELEAMIGKGAERNHRPGTLEVWEKSWAVYCTLWQMVESRRVPKAKPVFDKDGRLNPLLTEIPLPVVLNLAQDRDDAGEIISSLATWYEEPAPPSKRHPGAAPNPKLALRDEAIKAMLDQGLRPGDTVAWGVFSGQILTKCNAKSGDRGFSERNLKRLVSKELKCRGMP